MKSLQGSRDISDVVNRKVIEKMNMKEMAEVKQEILDVVQWIDNERHILDKIVVSSSKLADSLSSSSLSDLHAIKHRLKEVNILLDVQSIKRQSMKYNEELIRAYANSNKVVSNRTSKRSNPNEHFKRAVPSKTTPKTVVFNDSLTSHWEGSDYKYSLVVSLKKKLLLKLVFFAIECYRQLRVNARQAVFSADRLRTKKLIQLCFRSLRFEALTVRYIELNSWIKCDLLIRRKYIEPTFTELYKRLYIAKQYCKHVEKVSTQHFKTKHLTQALDVLRKHNKYQKRLRALKVWSKTKTFVSVQMKAFLAWMFALVKKHSLRLSIQNRFSEGGQVLNKQSSDKLSRSILVDIKRNSTDPLGESGSDRRKKPTRSKSGIHFTAHGEEEEVEQVTVQIFRDAVSDYSIASIRGMKHHIAQGRHYKSNKRDTGTKNRKNLLVDTLYSEYFIRDFTHSLNEVNRDTSAVFGRMRSTARSLNHHDSDNESVMSDDSLSPVSGEGRRRTKTSKGVRSAPHRGLEVTTHSSHTALVVPLPSLIPSHLREQLISVLAARKLVPSLSGVLNQSLGGGSVGVSTNHSLFSSIGGMGTPPEDSDEVEDYRRAVNDEFSLLDHHSSCSDSPGATGVTSTNRSKLHHSLNQSSFASQHRGSVMERALELSVVLSSPVQLQSVRSTLALSQHFDQTFCGAIYDVDSDFESNVLNNHYGISQVDVERRKSAFEDKMRSQFQLLKFNWIIKKLRLFVRTLRQMSKCSKGHRLTHLSHLRRTKDLAFRAWCRVYSKCRKEAQLCYQIYCINLSRRYIRAWHDCSVLRLRKYSQSLVRWCRLNRLQETFSVWNDFAERVRIQQRAIVTVKRVVMSQVWTTWMQLVRDKKRIYSLYKLVVLNRIRVRMNGWKEKVSHSLVLLLFGLNKCRQFQRRRLLKRVFTVCETAWAYRSYYNSHHFYLLFNIFGAWSVYTKRNRKLAIECEQQNKALYFRGVSLMVRFYFKWCDFVSQSRKTKKFLAHRTLTHLKVCFDQWSKALESRKRLQQNSSVHYHRGLCRRVFRLWRNTINFVTSELPLEYKAGKLMRQCFDAWRVLRATCELQSRWVPLWEGRLLHRRFQDWKELCQRHTRLKACFPVLTEVYYKIKLRQCFMKWPGRLECLRARQMLTYIQKKGKFNRVRLVDVDETVSETQVVKDRKLLDEERKKADANSKSFIQIQRPTLTMRAVKHKFIHSDTDIEGIGYIFLLMSTVLREWMSVVKSYRYYHSLAVKVRYHQRRHTEKMVLRHWMKLTPATTHRSITWIHKRNKRLHDDYEFHKKDNSLRLQTYAAKMDEEYKEYLNNLKQVKLQSLLLGV